MEQATDLRTDSRMAGLDPRETGVMRLRVVTYNVHKCRGMDGRTNIHRIAEVLRDVNADVVALQEAVDPQAETIAAELGLSYCTGENRKHHGYGYGNAVLSRLPVL